MKYVVILGPFAQLQMSRCKFSDFHSHVSHTRASLRLFWTATKFDLNLAAPETKLVYPNYMLLCFKSCSSKLVVRGHFLLLIYYNNNLVHAQVIIYILISIAYCLFIPKYAYHY